ncbi:MAG: ABC transporter permease subunit [Spirochaetia bacterium]|nr:ABC transporter permease subunit [Spirochaetia bacterium]
MKYTLSIPGLSKAWWVFLKEWNSFLGSNLAPITVGLVAFLCGLVSVVLGLTPGATYEEVTRILFYFFYIIIIVAGTMLSMSAFVHEKRQGTLELLYTLPVSDLELVLGKFLMGSAFLSLISVAITLVYVKAIGEAPWYIVGSGIFGLILVGMYAYSVGLFASTLADSHLVAMLVAAVILAAIDIGGFLSGLLPSPAKEIFGHMHGLHQFNPFSRGIIPFKGTVFFLSLTVLFQFLSVKVLESRRWRAA